MCAYRKNRPPGSAAHMGGSDLRTHLEATLDAEDAAEAPATAPRRLPSGRRISQRRHHSLLELSEGEATPALSFRGRLRLILWRRRVERRAVKDPGAFMDERRSSARL